MFATPSAVRTEKNWNAWKTRLRTPIPRATARVTSIAVAPRRVPIVCFMCPLPSIPLFEAWQKGRKEPRRGAQESL